MAQVLQNARLALTSIAFAVSLMECGLWLRDYGSVVRVFGEHVLGFPDPVRTKRSGALWAVLRFLEPTQVGNAFEWGLPRLLPRAAKHHDPHVILGWPFLSDFNPEFASPKLDRSRYGEVGEEAWPRTRSGYSSINSKIVTGTRRATPSPPASSRAFSIARVWSHPYPERAACDARLRCRWN